MGTVPFFFYPGVSFVIPKVQQLYPFVFLWLFLLIYITIMFNFDFS